MTQEANSRLGSGQEHDAEQRGRGREIEEPTADNQMPRIEPGEYDAICYRAEYGKSWGGRNSLYVKFRIYEGKYDGVELFMVCSRPKGKLRTRHKLYQQWSLALGRVPIKSERFNKETLPNKMYRVLVRDTNRQFSNGRRMPDYLQYSVVDTILETLTGTRSPLLGPEDR